MRYEFSDVHDSLPSQERTIPSFEELAALEDQVEVIMQSTDPTWRESALDDLYDHCARQGMQGDLLAYLEKYKV